MAYQFADGFDNYGNAYDMVAGYPWDAVNGGNQATTTSDYRFVPPGSLPGGCIITNYNGGSLPALRKNLSGNLGTLIVGFGFKVASLPASPMSLCNFWDTGTSQLCLTVNSTGTLQFVRGTESGTAVGPASPSASIVAGSWYGISMQVSINSSTGTAFCYLNGSPTTLINGSGLNTSADGNAWANQVSIGADSYNGAPVIRYDDFYCFDSTGSYLNAPPSGDVRILTKMPASAGQYTNWTPNGLSNNYQNAAVQPPNTSDYNSNNTAGTKDSYTMQVAGLSVAPYFVVARASLARDDSATHTPGIFVRSNSVDSSGSTTPALTSSYLFYDGVFQNDPSTSTAWTGAGADAAQAGIIEG